MGRRSDEALGGRPSRDDAGGPDEAEASTALEFVRYCYSRRRVAWPALYDEMCAVAARSAFRGMGYTELAQAGISFCLGDLQKLATLAERVAREERGPEPVRHPAARSRARAGDAA